MLELLTDPQVWIAFATLTALEIVLGIDNIIFIAILVRRLPREQQQLARQIGLLAAMGTRILLLFSLTWLMKLTTPLFTVFAQEISGRDLILIGGGLFLLAKSTLEIHHSLEGAIERSGGAASMTFWSCVAQIGVLDIVFSLDSVITAIGLADHLEVMVGAIIVAVVVMMLSARSISEFVDRHPTIRMLALSFLILIGMALIGEGVEFHIPKGYIYFAMAFSVSVEMLNLKMRRRQAEPVMLRKALQDDQTVDPERETGG
ncbi:MAG: TerC family protein [Gammaproteobacteria bacterium]|nr:TerC family protein [Gammaproteobacteria bacterium]